MTDRERRADSQLLSLHNVCEERYNGDQDRRACPEEIEQNRIDAGWIVISMDLYQHASRRSYMRTFGHPPHLNITSIHCPINPSFLPSKEFDEFNLFMSNAISLKRLERLGQQHNLSLTAPISSFSTPILLSLAVKTPFWMRTLRRARNELRGQPRIRIPKPAKALNPSSL